MSLRIRGEQSQRAPDPDAIIAEHRRNAGRGSQLTRHVGALTIDRVTPDIVVLRNPRIRRLAPPSRP